MFYLFFHFSEIYLGISLIKRLKKLNISNSPVIACNLIKINPSACETLRVCGVASPQAPELSGLMVKNEPLRHEMKVTGAETRHNKRSVEHVEEQPCSIRRDELRNEARRVDRARL